LQASMNWTSDFLLQFLYDVFNMDALVVQLTLDILVHWQEYEGDLNALEKICREVVSHIITTAPPPDITSQPKPNDPSDAPQ
jgi:hydroxypyruvate isomerase